ncbi:MAG: hypothetical protein Q8N26_20525 [Myxococcales bacterium]|nr:hypothetical protein [Myxococcales bacterium]
MAALQPLSIGEIVDRSTSFWRTNWKALFQLLLGFQLAQYILLKTLELFAQRTFPAAANVAAALEFAKTDPSTWLPQLGPVVLGSVVVVMVNALVSQVAGVALTGFVYPRLTSAGTPSVADALRLSAVRLGTTFGMFALSMAWSALASLVFLLPGGATVGGGVWLALEGNRGAGGAVIILGLLLMFGGVVMLVLWFLIRFVLASQVLAVEDPSALACFRRTDQLSSGRVGPGLLGLVKGRLTLLITIIAFILLVVGLVTGLPELVVKGLFGEFNPTRAGASAPQALIVPAQLLQVIAGAAITPLYVVFQVVFYVDMRVRREGLDLELSTKAKAA